MYVERANDEANEKHKQNEIEWDRTRSLWVPFMKANFKKKGGGEYVPEDLIRLSFDKKVAVAEKPTIETFERLVSRHGKRKKGKRNGK